jgi:hypothetical protein
MSRKILGRVPFRYIREDFYLGGVFRNLCDLTRQLRYLLEPSPTPGFTPLPNGWPPLTLP